VSEFVFKLPDLGEGTVEAEVVEWHVKPGDVVREGDVIADLMTDKANVEVPAPVSGRVLRTTGEPGDVVPVGAELIAFETETSVAAPMPEPQPQGAAPEIEAQSQQPQQPQPPSEPQTEPPPPVDVVEPPVEREPSPADQGRVVTSPAIRKRAKEAGVDLSSVTGSGPRGRILSRDLDAYLASGTERPAPAVGRAAATGAAYQDVKVIGVRRVIAEHLAQSNREIPHFSYVEEIDVTELEALRRHLNKVHGSSLSVLPFIATALLRALPEFPQCNAHHIAQDGVVRRYSAVHLGIATQTADGLKVPVVRDAQLKSLWQLAQAIAAAAEAARSGTARAADLSGSTITLTSLGKLGGIVSTPIVNYPEVAIVGVNKAVERPSVVNGQIQIRRLMNLSSSFDHRFVDGFDAASLIQAVKRRLEVPATLFIGDPA